MIIINNFVTKKTQRTDSDFRFFFFFKKCILTCYYVNGRHELYICMDICIIHILKNSKRSYNNELSTLNY